MERHGVIIVAGGCGCRMDSSVPKQFLLLAGRPILMHTVARFAAVMPDASLVVVLPENEQERWENLCKEYAFEVPYRVVSGGTTRFESVRNGLQALPEVDLIAVHDGVRPLVSSTVIEEAFATAAIHATAVPVVRLSDSLRRVSGAKSRAEKRDVFRCVQTPQVFRSEVLREAYASDFSEQFTDDASVVEQLGVAITLCAGDFRNLKITRPEDLIVAEAFLQADRSFRKSCF